MEAGIVGEWVVLGGHALHERNCVAWPEVKRSAVLLLYEAQRMPLKPAAWRKVGSLGLLPTERNLQSPLGGVAIRAEVGQSHG